MKHFLLPSLFIVLLAGPMFGQPDDHPRREMRNMIEKLNLTDEQQTAFRELRSSTRKEMIDIQSEIKKMHVDLADMKRAEDADRATFEKVTRGIADLRVRQALLKFDTHQNMMKQLSPEQQEIFQSMKHERGKNFRGKKHDASSMHRRGRD